MRTRLWAMVRRPRSAVGGLLCDLALCAVAFGAPFLSGWVGAGPPATALVKMGPNTGFYLQGFKPHYELEGLLASRWTGYAARIDLPLRLRGGLVRIGQRSARVLPVAADVDVLLDGREIDRFRYRGDWFRVRWVEVGVGRDTPVVLDLHIHALDHQDLGLKVDWVQIQPGAGCRLGLRGWPLVAGPLLALLFFASLRALGHGRSVAFAIVLPLVAALTGWAQVDPMGLAHVAGRLSLVAFLLLLGLTWGLRRVAYGRWLLPVVMGAHLVGGAGLLHPTSYYQDFRHAERYAHQLVSRAGSLVERGRAAQRSIAVAYPRIIAGKAYAFPYSPLAYLPFAVFRDPDLTEDAYKQAGLLAATLTVLLVFFLTRALARGSRAEARLAVAAALVSALLAATYSRLLLAMGATLFGHLWDVVLIMAAVFYLRKPGWRRLVWVGIAAQVSLLLYVSSLFTVSAFLVVLAIVARRRALPLLGVLALTVTITVGWLYAPFVKEFFGEILPALLHGARMGTSSGKPASLVSNLARIPLFFGWGLPILAVGGGVVIWRRVDGAARAVLAAYLGAFLLLFGLRLFGGGLFRDLKETIFVGPLVAILAGAFLERLIEMGQRERWAAAMIIVGVGLVTADRYAGYLKAYMSPFVQAKHADGSSRR